MNFKIKFTWAINNHLGTLDYVLNLFTWKGNRKEKKINFIISKINLKIIYTFFVFFFYLFLFFVVSIKLLPLEASTTPKENLFTM